MRLPLKRGCFICDLRQRSDGDTASLTRVAAEYSDSARIQILVASILRKEHHSAKAINILLAAQAKNSKDTTIAFALALCHSEASDNASAIAELQRVDPDDFPDVAISLAEAFERDDKKDEALRVIQRCHAKHPTHKLLRFKYARLAQELDLHAIAASILNSLCGDDPKSIDYWGYLGNSCLELGLNDTALCCYRRAEKLMEEGQTSQWIVANIGNLLNNRELPTEACEYLERSLKYEPRSEYAHDRLAGALKKKAAEEEEFQKKCAEGKRRTDPRCRGKALPPIDGRGQRPRSVAIAPYATVLTSGCLTQRVVERSSGRRWGWRP